MSSRRRSAPVAAAVRAAKTQNELKNIKDEEEVIKSHSGEHGQKQIISVVIQLKVRSKKVGVEGRNLLKSNSFENCCW